MTEMSLKEAFKVKRDVENYVEKWENARPEDDPLLKNWKDHIEENRTRCGKEKKRK
jgi:cyclopropane fatty-acyl-phospholipid synthase-like methyltransferase